MQTLLWLSAPAFSLGVQCSFPAQEDPLSSLGVCRKGADRPLTPNLGGDPGKFSEFRNFPGQS